MKFTLHGRQIRHSLQYVPHREYIDGRVDYIAEIEVEVPLPTGGYVTIKTLGKDEDEAAKNVFEAIAEAMRIEKQ